MPLQEATRDGVSVSGSFPHSLLGSKQTCRCQSSWTPVGSSFAGNQREICEGGFETQPYQTLLTFRGNLATTLNVETLELCLRRHFRVSGVLHAWLKCNVVQPALMQWEFSAAGAVRTSPPGGRVTRHARADAEID